MRFSNNFKKVFICNYLLVSAFSSYCQVSEQKNIILFLGIQTTPGIAFGWNSTEYELRRTAGSEDSPFFQPYVSCGIDYNVIYKRIHLSVGIKYAYERLLANVPINFGGLIYGSRISYDLDYRKSYFEIPITIGYVLRKSQLINKRYTYISAGVITDLIAKERRIRYNSGEIYYGPNMDHYNLNSDTTSNIVRYSSISLIFKVCRITPFKFAPQFYFKRAIAFYTKPINHSNEGVEQIANSRVGVEIGFSYHF